MIQDTLSKVVYTADGEQRQWDVPFQFNDSKDLHIYLTDDGVRVEEVFQNFEYNEESKHIIYPTPESGLAPLEAGKQILVLRETPNTQEEDSSEIYFKSKDIERGLDKLTMQVQELARDSYRAVKVSHFDTTTPEDFTEMLFEAGAKAEEAAARAATSESNAALSEQNAASSKLSAEQASASAVAAAELAKSHTDNSLRNAERAEQAAADSDMHATHAAESASMAADLLQEVSDSIYNKAQVDAKISGLQAEIDMVESYIPSGTSDSNMLVNKKELLDEEMDIREDLNQGLSELQTQITAQSSIVAGKQDKLIAGPNITINGNVISATGSGEGGGSEAVWGAITGDINAQTDLTTAIAEKQDKLTAGEGITIDGNVISATSGGGGGSAELPDNVYTSDNLVSGENVEIKEVVDPNILDDDSILCLHFENNVQDSSKYANSADGSGLTTEYSTTAKFGSASAYSNNGALVSPKFSEISDSLTIDFWAHKTMNPNVSGTQITLGSFSFAAYGSEGQPQFYLQLNNATTHWPYNYDSSLLVNDWNHFAGVFSKNEEGYIVVRFFVNGNKVLEDTTSQKSLFASWDDLSFINFMALGGVDEFRVSKKAVWTEDFTPSAEPYAVSSGGSKKSINAIIPEGIYTQSNLLSGKNIEIIPEPVDGGIDEYTIGMWHFDTDGTDEITGTQLSSFTSDRIISSDYKFGTGCYYSNYAQAIGTFFERNLSYTVDMWYKHISEYTNFSIGINCDTYSSTDSPTNGYRLIIGGSSITLQHSRYYENNTTFNTVSFPFYSSATWHHIAVQKINNEKIQVFIDGNLLIEQDIDESLAYGSKVIVKGQQYIDELRLSNTIRWTEDFEPPTQPYRKAEPTGNYVINYIKPVGEVEALKTDFSNYGGFPHTIDPQKTDGVLHLQTNKIYRLALEGHTVLSLPTMPDETTSSNQILVKTYVNSGASLDWGTYNFYNKTVPTLQEETYYDLVFDYDQGQLAWVAAAIPSGRTDI